MKQKYEYVSAGVRTQFHNVHPVSTNLMCVKYWNLKIALLQFDISIFYFLNCISDIYYFQSHKNLHKDILNV